MNSCKNCAKSALHTRQSATFDTAMRSPVQRPSCQLPAIVNFSGHCVRKGKYKNVCFKSGGIMVKSDKLEGDWEDRKKCGQRDWAQAVAGAR